MAFKFLLPALLSSLFPFSSLSFSLSSLFSPVSTHSLLSFPIYLFPFPPFLPTPTLLSHLYLYTRGSQYFLRTDSHCAILGSKGTHILNGAKRLTKNFDVTIGC